MAQDMEAVRTGMARPIGPAGPEWAPEPQIITPIPTGSHLDRDFVTQITPPALAGTIQEKWAKVVTPFRALAFFFLWITWHWARSAALVLFLILILIFILVK